MTYRNTKTGAVIDSPCPISGGDWVPEGPIEIVAVPVVAVPEEPKESPEPKKKVTPAKKRR